LDCATKVREWSLGDLYDLAHQEWDSLGGLFFLDRLFDTEQPVHLVGPERHRQPARAHELDHALDAVDRVDGFLVQIHLHEHVPRVDLPLDVHLLAVLDLHDFLRGDQGLPDRLLRVGPGILGNAPRDQVADLVLMARRRLDRVPAEIGH